MVFATLAEGDDLVETPATESAKIHRDVGVPDLAKSRIDVACIQYPLPVLGPSRLSASPDPPQC